MYPKISVVRVFSRLNIGGPSIHVILLTAGLNPARFQSTLIVGQEGPQEGNMFELADRYNIHPVKIPSLGREISLLNDLWTTFQLWRYMRRVRPHIVHTHTSKAGFSGRLAAWLAGVPVVVHTFHGHVFHGYFGPVLTNTFIFLERYLARLSDAIITISERLKEDLLERKIAPAEKIQILELGLDLESFVAVRGRTFALRSEMRLDAETPLVGIVGRLVPIKDHRTFLEAAALACKAHPTMRFAIVGDGELRPQLEALTEELGLGNRVYFAGWRKDLASVYADLDLVVISSRNEGTPVSLIEGAAAGKPVVATRVGGIPDLLEDGKNGLLVPSAQPQALCDAMLKVLGTPGLAAALASEGKEQIRRRFGIHRLISDMESLYCSLLERKGISLQGIGVAADGIAQ